MMRIGRESFGEHHRAPKPRDARQGHEHSPTRGDFADDEITLANARDVGVSEKRRWHDLVLGVRDRYKTLKEKLIARTNNTLEKVADTYVEKYLTERDPKTGETPNTHLRKFTRACEAAYSSVGIQAAFELGIRAALHPLEFSAQMAMKQFGVDIAVRQAEYTAVSKKYEYDEDGVANVEKQALEFANAVRTQFEALGKKHGELPGEQPEEREDFRQERISQAMGYAHTILERFPAIDYEARNRILRDLNTHLDTVVFNPNRSSLLQRWDTLRGRYNHDIQSIVTKHIDLYQKRQSRNLAVLTTASRWLTLGTETYLIQRGLSASRALGENYTRELTKMPAEQRTVVERMRALGRATAEGVVQLTGFDRYRALRTAETGMQSRADELIAGLLPPEKGNIPDADFPVDEIEETLWNQYGRQLEAQGLDRAWLYDKIEDIGGYEKNQRGALAELVKYRLEGLHRQYLKAATQHAEHVYDQYNINVTAISVLADVDMAVNEATRLRDGVGMVLEQMSDTTAEISIPSGELKALDRIEERQYHAVKSLVQDVSHAVQILRDERAAVEVAQVVQVEAEADLPKDIGPEIAPEDAAWPTEVHAIEKGDSLWKLAVEHADAYRARDDDPEMTVNDVLHAIASDNKIDVHSTLQIGQELRLASRAQIETHEDAGGDAQSHGEQPPHVLDYTAQARYADAGEPVDGLIPEIGRETIALLPEGAYTIVLGVRYSAPGERMPIEYTGEYVLTVGPKGDAFVSPMDRGEYPIPLNRFLAEHQEPIVRVFSEQAENVQIEREALHAEEWSQHNQALIRFLQDNPITVEERKGAYCARDVAGRLNLFDEQLSSEVGMAFRDREGNVSGVVAHAPLVAASLEASGGHVVSDLQEYFDTSSGRVQPTEQLSGENPEYRAAVQEWIRDAEESPLQVASFFYDHTKIQSEILRNQKYGGDVNSHVVLLLGEKDVAFQVQKDMTLEHAMERQFGMRHSDMTDRGWMFETLGIEVNGVMVTSEQDWRDMRITPADQVVVHDVAMNHRYHTDRADTLVALMVNDGALHPVSVIQPNAELLNERLAYHGNGGDYAIDTFHQVQSGETLVSILEKENYPRDLWTAAEFAMRAQGQNPNALRPGELVSLYTPAELRAHIDDVYATEEHRRMQSSGDVVHIVRPGETMDELAGALFDRAQYSHAEWAGVKSRLASLAGDTGGVVQRDVEMPGDAYTQPYHMTQYEMHADGELHFDRDALARIDERIVERRLAERVYIPEALPVYTAEGIVEQKIPEHVREAINTVVDAHPDYGEGIREALVLVYVNEGMRERAEKNVVTKVIEAADQEFVQPNAWVAEVVDSVFQTSVAHDFMSEYTSARDGLVGVSEYLSSRQMLKDVAWWVHDTPAAAAVLQRAIDEARSGVIRETVVNRVVEQVGNKVPREVIDEQVGEWVQEQTDRVADKLETVRDVSSAGVFQVRANNFISDDGSWNMTDALLGRHFETQEELEQALRADVRLNAEAAAAILYQNRIAIETYAQAAHDPAATARESVLLADVNSYNGGPYKTLLGGLQTNMMELAREQGVTLPIQEASGRGTPQTREAFIALCHEFADHGRLQLTKEQIQSDAALLGQNTIGFLRSESFAAVQQIYADQFGARMTVLPTMDSLSRPDVSYGNYGYLANRGQALAVLEEFSGRTRVALGNAVILDYAKNDRLPKTAAQPT